MFKFSFLPMALLLGIGVQAQNLVNNPGFETINICPNKHGQTASALANSLQGWFSPNTASPDVFTPCSGSVTTTPLNIIPPAVFNGRQLPHSGSNFVGVYNYGQWSEYVSTSLTQVLTAGTNYAVSFYVACADNQKMITDAIGMHISDNALQSSATTAFVNATPQVVSTPGYFIIDTAWVKVSGIYQAHGGEKYITLGHFFAASTNPLSVHIQTLAVAPDPTRPYPELKLYYYIDDVALQQTISGPLRVCASSSQTYSIPAVTGATAYTWTLPNGWTGSSTTETISVTAGTSAGTITVMANDPANTSFAIPVSVDQAAPLQPGSISGNAVLCANQAKTYSISPVANAASYTWSLPNGWTGSSVTTDISITANSNSGTVSVTAANACGASPVQTLAISVASVPSTPIAISGPAMACLGQINTYSVTADANVSLYTWALPNGWTGTSISNTIAVTATASTGSITVVAGNGCGSSSTVTLGVISGSIPTQPLSIDGSLLLCAGQALTYSVAPVSNATGYTWTLPSTWSGNSLADTIAVVVAAGSATMTVTADNSCGSSPQQTLALVVNDVPAQPLDISGLSSFCLGANVTYSIVPVANATGYAWTLPNGWTGASSTESITVSGSNGVGTLTVTAGNGCGASASQTLVVTVNDVPAQPVVINGPTAVCAGSGATYSVALASDASSYTWQMPGGWLGASATESISIASINSVGTLTVMAHNTCGASASQILSIGVNTAQAIVSQSNGQLTAGSADSYGWLDCANNYTLVASGTATFSPSQTGSYALAVTQNGCVDTSSCISVTVVHTGIDVLGAGDALLVYPNPANDKIHIRLPVQSGAIKLVLLDSRGALAYEASVSSSEEIEIPLTQLHQGVYLLQVQSATGKIHFQKLNIVR